MAEASATRELSVAVRESDRLLELFKTYSPSVYAVCLRITRNHHDAEDLTQQYFLDLLSQKKDLPAGGGACMRVTALRRAADHVRRELARRRRHEELAKIADVHAPDPNPWDQIAPHIDETIDELPESLRDPIMMYYLLPLPKTEVANELHLSPRTVGRRIREGLDELQLRLKKKTGITLSLAALSLLLTENAVQAAPASLTRELGKMALFMGIQRGGEGISVGPAEWTTSASQMTAPPVRIVGSAARSGARKWVQSSVAGVLAVVTVLGAWSTGWRAESPSDTTPATSCMSGAPSSVRASLTLFEVDIPEPTLAFLAPKNDKAGRSDEGPQFGEEFGDYYAGDPNFVQRDRREVPLSVKPQYGNGGE